MNNEVKTYQMNLEIRAFKFDINGPIPEEFLTGKYKILDDRDVGYKAMLADEDCIVYQENIPNGSYVARIGPEGVLHVFDPKTFEFLTDKEQNNN